MTTDELKAIRSEWNQATANWRPEVLRSLARKVPALLDEVEALREAGAQALQYIERDETAHGRQFGAGNALRKALGEC